MELILRIKVDLVTPTLKDHGKHNLLLIYEECGLINIAKLYNYTLLPKGWEWEYNFEVSITVNIMIVDRNP